LSGRRSKPSWAFSLRLDIGYSVQKISDSIGGNCMVMGVLSFWGSLTAWGASFDFQATPLQRLTVMHCVSQ
jgi:hypothetical protein